MAATLMNGSELAARVRAQVAEDVRELGRVSLATVLVGDDPASHVYVGYKHKDCAEVGIESVDHQLPPDAREEQVLALVAELNRDNQVDGFIVQSPVPAQVSEARVMEAIDPIKDVDGFSPVNVGRLWLGREGHVSATPLGIMTLLREYGVELEGADAVIVGRSEIVGKPMAALLLRANATVTFCHTRTRDLTERTKRADLLVAAAGRAGLISPEMVKSGATVVDVGITRTSEGLVGDVDKGVIEVAGLLTPVPGGVGPMTRAMLLTNTVRAARARRGLLAFD
ncbi:MAG: bifunctional 5,10-methylenetetrahydrofolate dehydrogenase/5,10-methenyltetrahydrofolate cyclohydrolase [Gaiellaceae bacterium]|jgi:methylenetetrahydrofolate dehydrogenase (NADP+)/methenyltetrahydrofolate cyclohydrolase